MNLLSVDMSLENNKPILSFSCFIIELINNFDVQILTIKDPKQLFFCEKNPIFLYLISYIYFFKDGAL